MQQLPGCIKFRRGGQMPAHYLNHVELAHLYPILPELPEQSPHTVTHYPVYCEAVVTQPVHALAVVRHRFIPYELVPQYLVAECILDDHQSEPAPPIGRIHIDHYLTIFGDDMYVTHILQLVPDGLYTDTVPVGNLLQCQLFFNILVNYRLTVRTSDIYKLPAAIVTLEQLLLTFMAVPFYTCRSTPLTLFLFIFQQFSDVQNY